MLKALQKIVSISYPQNRWLTPFALCKRAQIPKPPIFDPPTQGYLQQRLWVNEIDRRLPAQVGRRHDFRGHIASFHQDPHRGWQCLPKGMSQKSKRHLQHLNLRLCANVVPCLIGLSQLTSQTESPKARRCELLKGSCISMTRLISTDFTQTAQGRSTPFSSCGPLFDKELVDRN